eukprot:2686975-Pleurochrysis_carterae.AAC.1
MYPAHVPSVLANGRHEVGGQTPPMLFIASQAFRACFPRACACMATAEAVGARSVLRSAAPRKLDCTDTAADSSASRAC